MKFAPVSVFIKVSDGSSSCLKVKDRSLNVLTDLQILEPKIITVNVYVHLEPLFFENQSWFLRFVDCSPHLLKLIVSVVDCSHWLINDCWSFVYTLSFWLLTETSIVKSFSSVKAISCSDVPAFKQKNYCFIKSFLLLERYDVLFPML